MSSQGEMLTQKEKIEVVRKKLCEVGVKEGWEVIFFQRSSSAQTGGSVEKSQENLREIHQTDSDRISRGGQVQLAGELENSYEH